MKRKFFAMACLVAVLQMLSCRPAWHPSGNVIAFSYTVFDKDIDLPEKSGLAMYNVKEDKVSLAFQSDDYAFWSGNCLLWAPDGKCLYALVGGRATDGFDVLKFAEDGKTFSKVTGVSASFMEMEAVGMPPFLAPDGKMWIGPVPETSAKQGSKAGGDTLTYLNIDMNSGVVRKLPAEVRQKYLGLFADGRGAHYYALVSPPARKGIGTTAGRTCDVEVGAFDAVDAVPIPPALFSAKLQVPAGGPPPKLFAIDPERNVFGVINQADGHGELSVLDSKGTVKTVDLAPKDKAGKPLFTDSLYGQCAWFDGKLWIPLYARSGKTHKDYGFAVVDVETGDLQHVSLGTKDDESSSSTDQNTLVPSVSPDGKTMAVCGYWVPPVGKTALFLFEKGGLKPTKVVPASSDATKE